MKRYDYNKVYRNRINKLRKENVAKTRKNIKTAENALRTLKSEGKGVVLKTVAVLLIICMIIIVICGGVMTAVCSFVWQTSSVLDTTMIIKYVSELDYNQQAAWYKKGKTNIEIEKQNDISSTRSYSYNYLLAVDVPLDDVENNNINCIVTTGIDSEGEAVAPKYKGFNYRFSSSDEMLEEYAWTTEDYRALLAYLQVKNENLGWLSSNIGFVGKMQLKKSAKELHEQTYNQNIVIKTLQKDNAAVYSYQKPIYSLLYSKDNSHSYYYFGRKYSVKYLIENDMVCFDTDTAKNESMKERFEYIYKYGNFAVANLSFPLEIGCDETISERIVKHFGTQLVLKYTVPEKDENKEQVYGKVTAEKGYHYAVDLSANEGDIIYSPIEGLCKVTQKEYRGFEYTICTSYTNNEFDYTKEGYLIKISCSGSSYINTSKVVNKGDLLGTVADNTEINYKIPSDIFAEKLFPCSTATTYHTIGANVFNVPKPKQNHIHIEMYKLPCDFTNEEDIENNVLAAELFFDYSNEEG